MPASWQLYTLDTRTYAWGWGDSTVRWNGAAVPRFPGEVLRSVLRSEGLPHTETSARSLIVTMDNGPAEMLRRNADGLYGTPGWTWVEAETEPFETEPFTCPACDGACEVRDNAGADPNGYGACARCGGNGSVDAHTVTLAEGLRILDRP